MAQNKTKKTQTRALEKAAKYICTAKCGLCPMVVEKYPCPRQCTLTTKPWQCWAAYFAEMAPPTPRPAGRGVARRPAIGRE
ncbi:MAG: hypothetical protein ACOY8P_04705 [Thermodesulfobacteriota bacterium]|jgi:hypothetical protein